MLTLASSSLIERLVLYIACLFPSEFRIGLTILFSRLLRPLELCSNTIAAAAAASVSVRQRFFVCVPFPISGKDDFVEGLSIKMTTCYLFGIERRGARCRRPITREEETRGRYHFALRFFSRILLSQTFQYTVRSAKNAAFPYINI